MIFRKKLIFWDTTFVFWFIEIIKIKKICIHSLAWSNLNGLNWFGPTYTAKSSKFYYKTKKGAKKGGRIKNSESAYIRNYWLNLCEIATFYYNLCEIDFFFKLIFKIKFWTIWSSAKNFVRKNPFFVYKGHYCVRWPLWYAK